MPFDYEKIADPEFFAENCVPAHSSHSFYKNWQQANAKNSSFVKSLNGLWFFNYAKNLVAAPQGFEKPEYNCKIWNDIRVPAHIEMEGYGAPQYTNIQYPWDGHEQIAPGQIPEEFNPVASYVNYFTLEDDMASAGNLYISLQGVESAFAIWLNGSYVGYSEDSFTPADFELTPYLKKGENKLAVQVYRFSAGSWLEDQDFFRFSGIFRDVFLYCVPQAHVWDLKIEAGLDDEYKTGLFSVTMRAAGEGRVKMQLVQKGTVVAEMQGELNENVRLEAQVENALLWSAEHPNLYQLKIEVFIKNEEIAEVIVQNTGFRRFELIGGIMCINGRRIEFNGVNRHEFNCTTGRVASRKDAETDLATMKQNNINAIRTSHYPNNSFLYELCDIYGLYVIDEVNLETHGIWDLIDKCGNSLETTLPGNKPEWRENVLHRANNLYQRDKNHPCVLIWSLGNESFGGKNLQEMYNLFHKQDPGRLVHYEGLFWDRRFNGSSDMESQMYTTADGVKKWLEENSEKPFIMCEYSHAMGNSCGAIHKYTKLLETHPRYQGGFIWDYVDQAVLTKDSHGVPYMGYGGDFGDRPNDGEFSGNGIVYPNRTPTPKMQEVKFVYQNMQLHVFENKVLIKNRALFTNTNEYICIAQLKQEGRLLETAEIATDVPPLSQREYALPFALPNISGEYTITVSLCLKAGTVWAKKGHEVAFGQGVFKGKDKQAPRSAVPRPVLVNGGHNFGVKGAHFEVLFTKIRGGLASYKYGGEEMLCSIPRPNFWRAPTNNDEGNFMAGRHGQWLLASRYPMLKDAGSGKENNGLFWPTVKELDGAYIFTYEYMLPTSPASACTVEYTVDGNGVVTVDLTCRPGAGLPPMPEFGMMFNMPAEYDTLHWYGNGPGETYIDRQESARLDVYTEKVADSLARYIVPQESGNKTGVRWARVQNSRGRGLLFAANSMEFSALPYTPFQLEDARHPNELPPVHQTVVRPALMRMGVGGDNSWGAFTHDEYILPQGKTMKFSFTFTGF